MSLFAEYIRETRDRQIIEDDYGFVSYIICGEECYIEDMFVLPHLRKEGVGSEMANRVKEIAKANGCKLLSCTINATIKDPTTSLKAILGYGFKVHSVLTNVIVLKMEI